MAEFPQIHGNKEETGLLVWDGSCAFILFCQGCVHFFYNEET